MFRQGFLKKKSDRYFSQGKAAYYFALWSARLPLENLQNLDVYFKKQCQHKENYIHTI